jgi:hypothetical protein
MNLSIWSLRNLVFKSSNVPLGRTNMSLSGPFLFRGRKNEGSCWGGKDCSRRLLFPRSGWCSRFTGGCQWWCMSGQLLTPGSEKHAFMAKVPKRQTQFFLHKILKQHTGVGFQNHKTQATKLGAAYLPRPFSGPERSFSSAPHPSSVIGKIINCLFPTTLSSHRSSLFPVTSPYSFWQWYT